MPAQVFGNAAAAVELYIAFYGQAPSNPIYNNLVSVATSSPIGVYGLATEVGKQFATLSDSALATQILTNVGITATTIPAASYTVLQAALAQAFAAYPGQRGIVVLNALNLLTTLETDVTFGSVAQTFNQAVTNSYVYASNTANVQTSPIGTITTTQPLTVNAGDLVTGTAGNDNINGNLFFNSPSGTFFQTLNTGDTVNGGAGTDNLNVGFNNAGAQALNATLTSIESLSINATGAGATTIDMTNGTGLASIGITSGQAGGDVTLTNLGSLLTTVTLNSTAAGLSVGSTAAATAGTADAVAVNLTQAGSAAAPVVLSLAGYETINVSSNGPATNGITLGYSASATAAITGTTSLSLSTGASTNTLTVNASGMTGAGSLAVVASGSGGAAGTAGNNLNVTGSANGDSVSFALAVAAGAATGVVNAASTATSYSAADTYNGAAGTDTISLAAGNANNVTANQGNLSNLETLQIVDSATASGAASAYTPASFGGATSILFSYNPAVSAGNAATAVAIAAAGVSPAVAVTSGTGTASNQALTVNYAAGTGGFTTLGNNTGAQALNSTGSATTDVLNYSIGGGTSANLIQGTITTTGFETVNLSSNGQLGAQNVVGAVTLNATAATEIVTVSGTRDLIVTGLVQADQINASAMTGNLRMTTAAQSAAFNNGALVTDAGVKIDGGSGSDSLYGSVGADQITGGAGNDRILVAAAGNANQGDILTGGAGADQFVFQGATNAAVGAQSSGTGQIVKITDFVAGTDKVALVNTATAVTGVNFQAAQTIAAADTLTQIYAGTTTGAASGTATVINAKLVTVSTGLAAGSYVYLDSDNSGTVTNADMLINVTGVTGTISGTDFVFA